MGCWIRNFLVPRWLKKQQSCIVALACVLRDVYVCTCCCYCYYGYLRKAYISPNKPGNITLLYGGIASELIGYFDCCAGWVCDSGHTHSCEWQKWCPQGTSGMNRYNLCLYFQGMNGTSNETLKKTSTCSSSTGLSRCWWFNIYSLISHRFSFSFSF